MESGWKIFKQSTWLNWISSPWTYIFLFCCDLRIKRKTCWTLDVAKNNEDERVIILIGYSINLANFLSALMTANLCHFFIISSVILIKCQLMLRSTSLSLLTICLLWKRCGCSKEGPNIISNKRKKKTFSDAVQKKTTQFFSSHLLALCANKFHFLFAIIL